MNAQWIETARWRESRGEHFGTPCSEEMAEGYWECGECCKRWGDEEDSDNCCTWYCCDERMDYGEKCSVCGLEEEAAKTKKDDDGDD